MKSEELIKTTLRLPKKLFQEAKILAVKEERSFQDILAEALKAYLKIKGRKK